ncbi:MAG: hypothetical protein AAF674_15285 [Pseudomonadota bacterium]
MKHFALAVILAATTGCATVMNGTSQQISISSNAKDALCEVVQNGVEVVPPQRAPATFLVPRRAGNLVVTCSADGYEPNTVALIAGKSPLAVGSAVALGATGPAFSLAGVGADAATGSWHEYQDRAYVYLIPKSPT